MMFMNQPYHLVDKSPWALMTSFNLFGLVSGFIMIFLESNWNLFFFEFLFVSFLAYKWWRDISRESGYQGYHSDKVSEGLYMSMIFFIMSEIFFFFSFFWGYFHSSLAMNMELGFVWPPVGIISFNPYSIPLLNSIILLSSGVTVTWAHHAILDKDFNGTYYGFLLTLLLGFYFTFLQGLEYLESFFCMSDSVYSSIFFLATGFHGVHVIVGSLYLLISFLRCMKGKISSIHHVGAELAIWYWHFVDVVWLFLYSFVYWWWY